MINNTRSIVDDSTLSVACIDLFLHHWDKMLLTDRDGEVSIPGLINVYKKFSLSLGVRIGKGKTSYKV